MSIRSFEGHVPLIHASAFVDEQAMVCGRVSIGADSSIWPMTVVRGDINAITIGERTNVQDGSVLHVNHDSEFAPGGAPLVIGNDVTVGHRVVLHACSVEDLCLVGMGAVILDGAIIRSGAIIGAGALVSPHTDLEGGYLYIGAPARRARELTDQEKRYLEYSAKHYAGLKDRHIKG